MKWNTMTRDTMTRNISFAVIALLAALPLLAQAPKGWKVRTDRSVEAEDPDAAGAVKLTATGSGFHVTTPQAAVFWNPANSASGNYSLKGTFTLQQPTGHAEYYGIIFAGSGLEGAAQSYLYFVVAEDGTWLVKHRSGPSTETVVDKTPNAAVKQPDASGKATNALEVRVGASKIDFVVNGTVVGSTPKSGVAAKTDGVYGIRSNHHLELQVDNFGMGK
jgi:hypothetical protein